MSEHARSRDFLAALLFVGLGVGAVAIAADYSFGSLRRLGPGALPLIVGSLLIAAGLLLALQCWLRGAADGPLLPTVSLPSWRLLRAVVCIAGSLIVFALLIRPAGLFLATAALALIARQAEPGATPLGSVVLAVCLAAVCSVIFVAAIGLPFRVWP